MSVFLLTMFTLSLVPAIATFAAARYVLAYFRRGFDRPELEAACTIGVSFAMMFFTVFGIGYFVPGTVRETAYVGLMIAIIVAGATIVWRVLSAADPER
ncbi:MAG: hypothetical protein ACRD3N_00190 [Terracidiphilus sp.]